MNFDEFFRGYVRCAMTLESDGDDEPLYRNYSEAGIAPTALAAMRRDCEKFASENAADLQLYCTHVHCGPHGSASEYAGHDFWLTANGHGSGFWDRDGVGESGRGEAPAGLGERLSKASKRFASDLYVGDDDQIYVSPERP